jgi:signal transduction histidine kinase
MKSETSEAQRYAGEELESGMNRIGQVLDAASAYGVLLDAALGLSPEGGPHAIVKHVLDALSSLMPYRAFGVCLVATEGDEPLVELRLPPGVAEPGRAPARLFPELGDEKILELPGVENSTLHVASVHGPLDSGTVEATAVERAAALLGNGVRAAIALKRARPVSEEIEELRNQLIQAEKLATLGQIVAGVVHELANPVTSIVACTKYLEKKAAAGEKAHDDLDYLNRIGVAADRILKFSRDLVAYARPANEKPAPVAIHEVIGQAYRFCEHELARAEVEFVSDFGDGAPPVFGQSGPLTQVFVNLFTNAAHAMSDHGGRLSVRTHVQEDVDGGPARLVIDVTDTGIGIPAETLGRIFEPFFTTKERGRGTGLGLAIVREIVQAHGGAIDAASTLGEGTTFTVVLPLYKKDAVRDESG